MQADLNPVVWGYRNVWFRFHPSETTVMAPVDDAGLDEMNDAFLTCFSTQKVRT
jgi:glucosamine-6-phosphate deaminase